MKKPPLLLLHGALGSSETFLPLKNFLDGDFDLHWLDFEGHGKASPGPDRPFRMEYFAENVLAYMKENHLEHERPRVLGYSMGGYVALLLAKDHPGLFHSVFTLGTKLFWTDEAGKREARFLDPEKMEKKVPHFAHNLKQRHGEDRWRPVVEKTAELLLHLGGHDLLKEESLKEINIPVRIGVGDRDQMGGMENSLKALLSLTRGELAVLSGTDHPLELVDFSLLSSSIRQFFGDSFSEKK